MAHHARVRLRELLARHRARAPWEPLAGRFSDLAHDPRVRRPRPRAGASRQREAHHGDGSEGAGRARRVAREVAQDSQIAIATPLAREVTLAADSRGQVALSDWTQDAVGGGGDVGVSQGATRAATRAANRITVAGPYPRAPGGTRHSPHRNEATAPSGVLPQRR